MGVNPKSSVWELPLRWKVPQGGDLARLEVFIHPSRPPGARRAKSIGYKSAEGRFLAPAQQPLIS